MNNEALAKLFYRELEKIHLAKDKTLVEQIQLQYKLLNLLFVEVTKSEKLQFTTLFARISYAGHKYNLSKQLQFYIHEFRNHAQKYGTSSGTPQVDPSLLYLLGLQALTLSISSIFKQGIPGNLAALLPRKNFYNKRPRQVAKSFPFAKVLIEKIDEKQHLLFGRWEENPGEEISIRYHVADRNENFTENINSLKSVFGFPVIVHLLDIEVDEKGVLCPRAFVIEPDYLVDVSAIAECFKEGTTLAWSYLLRKFMPFQATKPIMIGNIANFFLDELMSNPDATFLEIFPKVFELNPLGFTKFSNRDVREIMEKSQLHYTTLKQMVLQGFKAQGIDTKDCFLEPSFYAPKYGIQGRLDVFYKNPNSEKDSAIIELKSGKIWKPNKWGLSENHYVQTLLYDLMIKSAFQGKLIPTNYILYSGDALKPLRFAPVTKTKQFEAIRVKNDLVTLEYQLAQFSQNQNFHHILDTLNPDKHPHIKGFLQRDLKDFYKVYSQLSPLERKYFHAHIGFIAKEHQLAKTGIQGIDNLNGLASLWLNPYEDKYEQFDIISHLEIRELATNQEEPLIYFNRTAETAALANFRVGDIAILYPHQEDGNGVLNNQIFKCTIVELDKEIVVVRLRAKQFNSSIFEKHNHWNLEHDLFDSGYNSMYKSLFEFFKFDTEKRNKFLTLQAPSKTPSYEKRHITRMTAEQIDIFHQAIHAPDYFLLWGPPGTGKTSVMLRQFVNYIINETDENVLLLAYTNRAVDEICESIESIDDLMKEEYIRIGSTFSTAPKFRERLLSHKSKQISTRAELSSLIDKHRIFVSTLASISSKKDLLELKKFHRVIIDEASQILEPHLMGLLPHFERTILIGDHKQLPAVVTQDPSYSKIEDSELNAIGIHNLRDSLFERLYKRCIEMGWDWAYAQLSHQGRMHRDIMRFPNSYFYEGNLDTLPEELSMHHVQKKELQLALPHQYNALEEKLCASRMVFISTPIEKGTQLKINASEAQKIAKILQAFHNIYEANGLEFNASTIGIITPYRAQIARIKQEIEALGPLYEEVTIDTVERYQGGARDIILISFCTNQSSQLTSLVSSSEDGVDRKLNVALTRARKHLVMLGNTHILKDNPTYKALIEQCSSTEVLD